MSVVELVYEHQLDDYITAAEETVQPLYQVFE